ncbi:MAG: ribonuclease J [Rickettsiales bacterium]|nr:ribonuclease J [Rickettsiales bacterium]
MEFKSLNFKKHKNDLLFIPIGGSNEVGLNCNLYHYGGKWLIVDCGIGFIKTVPGVSICVPDSTLLKKVKKDIVGIFITHIHEDHLGALPHIWPDIRVPIYASRFTKIFLYEKLKEYDFVNELEIIEINEGQKVKLAPFEVECLNLTHSTPEMNALVISTPEGKILHTGDWKFDDNPVVGHLSNIKRLKQLGKNKELLATVCDSTNIFSTKNGGSEGDLFDNFYDIVKKIKGIVVFTTFASNVARLKTIIDVAKKTNRKVVAVGLSIFKLIKVAKEVGYLEEDIDIYRDDDLKNYKKRNLIVIATGCQGETNAAMDKIVNDNLRNIHLESGDAVVFSSSVIPGNEKDLIYLYNKLAEKDIEVFTDKNYPIHISGHYTVKDLKSFYSYVRPKVAVAVHGEAMHLAEHQKVAKECGIENTVKSANGMVLRISEKKTEVIGRLATKVSLVDGKRLIEPDNNIIEVRKKMEEAGVIFVNVLIDDNYKLVHEPVITAPGGYNLCDDFGAQAILIEDTTAAYYRGVKRIKEIVESGKKKFDTDDDKERFIANKIVSAINKIYNADIGKIPYMEIFFTRIKPFSLGKKSL